MGQQAATGRKGKTVPGPPCQAVQRAAGMRKRRAGGNETQRDNGARPGVANSEELHMKEETVQWRAGAFI